MPLEQKNKQIVAQFEGPSMGDISAISSRSTADGIPGGKAASTRARLRIPEVHDFAQGFTSVTKSTVDWSIRANARWRGRRKVTGSR